MIRVGTHYVEGRRIAYFIVEGLALWLAFAAAAVGVSALVGRRVEPSWLVHGLWVVGAIEVGFYFVDLHDLRVALGDAGVGQRLHRALGAAVILVGAALAFGLAPRRPEVVVAGVGAAAVLTLALRASLPLVGQRLALRTRIFLLGSGRSARHLAREVAADGSAEVVGFGGPRSTGIAERARASGATVIVVAADDRRGLPTHELLSCRATGIEVIDAATLATRVLHRLPIELVRPSDLIFQDGFARPAWLVVARRALSIVATLVLLAIAWPIVLITAILVRLDSPGPILFRQERVGALGRSFEMLKFRTMRVDAEQMGAKWAQKDDPRVTRVGKYLRRFRIDELPQLWNVLRGDMELVGPRPERPEFVQQLRRRIPYYDLRHLVPPGITGYAQVGSPGTELEFAL